MNLRITSIYMKNWQMEIETIADEDINEYDLQLLYYRTQDLLDTLKDKMESRIEKVKDPS